MVCPLLWPGALLDVLIIIDPCPYGFTSDFECFIHPFAEQWCQSLPHLEACFRP
jgi:hypothetical protein